MTYAEIADRIERHREIAHSKGREEVYVLWAEEQELVIEALRGAQALNKLGALPPPFTTALGEK
jgi:hypothetical protein